MGQENIGWNFPNSNHGKVSGISEVGIETFKGSLYSSLAREICQNSLDASLDNSKPVTVEFDLKEFNLKQDGINSVFSNDEAIYNEIAEMLGVLPEIIDNSAKGIVLVEGKDDVLFFKHITKLLKNAGEINKTFEEENIITLPTGGCDNLKYWILYKKKRNRKLLSCRLIKRKIS